MSYLYATDDGHEHIHADIPPPGRADESAVGAINRLLQVEDLYCAVQSLHQGIDLFL